MAQLIAAILILITAVAAFKVAIGLLLIAGLIFRTKETLALIMIFGLFAAFKAHPILGSVLLVVVLLIALARWLSKQPPDGPDQA